MPIGHGNHGERRRRRAAIYDNGAAEPSSANLGDGEGLGATSGPSDGWIATNDPDIIKRIVVSGTMGATQDGATAVSIGFPDAGFDTWYKPTQTAYTAGRAQAALDTIQATTDSIQAAATQISDLGAGLVKNFIPLLVGAAVLYFFLMQRK